MLPHSSSIRIICITTFLFLSLATAIPIKQSSNTTEGNFWINHPLIGQGPRQENSVTAIGEDVYVIGGVAYDDENNLQTLNRVEFYNVANQTWHVAAPLPVPLNHGNSAVVDGKIFLLGALSAGHNWVATRDSFVYTPSNDTWTNITKMPEGTGRGSSAVCAYKGKVYLAGGMTLLEPYKGGHQNSLKMVSSYDTATNSWDDKYPPLPEPRQHVGGAVVGSTFYVIGGRENGIEQYHNTTYALDLDNPTEWKTLAPMPTARGSLTCSAIGFQIYCFGGEGNPESWKKIFNESQVYDTRTNKWATLEPMAVPRHGTGSATVNGQIYIPGGGLTTAFDPTGIMDSFVGVPPL